MTDNPTPPLRAWSHRTLALLAACLVVAVAGAGGWLLIASRAKEADGAQFIRNEARNPSGQFSPTSAQWATLTVEPVQKVVFRPEHVTEGKIAVDEDRSTLIFSPFAGRITKLL